MAGHNMPFLMLYAPADRLAAGVLRNLLGGFCYGIVLIAGYARYAPLSAGACVGLLATGLLIAILLWGVFRLWSFTLAPALANAGTLARILSRIPFWYMAGAIGYPVGLILVKKMGWMDPVDIPMRKHVLFGGLFSSGIQSFFEAVVLFWGHGTHDKNRTA